MIQPMTHDEQQLMAIYNTGSRLDLIRNLNEMRTYLGEDEQELQILTDSAIAKLNAMTDSEFETLDLIPDFGVEDADGI